ncbi:hypothetical protein BJ165DRAFT_1523981 [Panaeolus papilionaceus]|nr:hypothetical protein BJ165DRAFT_1523981 [Panaeolus papilionaceus]
MKRGMQSVYSTLSIDPPPPLHSIPFPKKLFRRVPSCPSLSLHKFPKKMSMKFRERLSLVPSSRSNPGGPPHDAPHHHHHHDDYRRDEDGTSPVPTLLGRESEDGLNITPRTSASESDSDEVTVVEYNDRDEEDEEDVERADALHKMRSRISHRKILQHVPGFSDEEEDSRSQIVEMDPRIERRHSLASPGQYQAPNEVFWGLRATPYQSRDDLHDNQDSNAEETRTELRPPPWHKPRQAKMERTVPEE